MTWPGDGRIPESLWITLFQRTSKCAGGGDIHIAGKAGNRAFFDAEYPRWANGQQTYSQAASNIGTYYGQHENTTVNNVEKTYREHYISEHRRLGGHE